jgi:hypothetical protein
MAKKKEKFEKPKVDIKSGPIKFDGNFDELLDILAPPVKRKVSAQTGK